MEEDDPNDRTFAPDFSFYTMKTLARQARLASAAQATQAAQATAQQKLPVVAITPPQSSINYFESLPWSTKIVTKDQLWKTMIRAFRRYLKKEALSVTTMNQIKTLPLQRQGQALAHAIGLPAEFIEEPKYRYALLLIFFSHRYTRQRVLVQKLREIVGVHERELMSKFYLVFNENKNQIRLHFFQDPMVQFLWAKFRAARKDVIIDTFQKEGCQYFLDHILEM